VSAKNYENWFAVDKVTAVIRRVPFSWLTVYIAVCNTAVTLSCDRMGKSYICSAEWQQHSKKFVAQTELFH